MSESGDFITKNVFYTIAYHAQAHPANPIIGLLLSVEGSKSIDECVPLMHNTYLASIVETGLELVSVYAKKTKLKIKGVYYAENSTGDSQEDVRADMRFLAQLIAKNSGEDAAFLFRLSNDGLQATDDVQIDVFRVDSSSCKHRGRHAMAKEALAGAESRRVYDFEEYLEDPSLPWLLPQGEGLSRRR